MSDERCCFSILPSINLTVPSVSREEVAFVTGVPLAAGQRLAGTLRSASGPDGTATTLRYRARVVAVRRRDEDGAYEVEAQVEDLEFVPPGPA